ncbi:hypothetical protein [Erwinia sp. E_sp_B04_7]|uniref:hypothetical protein n=1 Tax=unclassified Erwinia TaxID=2622719 RepID=UPI0030D4F51E
MKIITVILFYAIGVFNAHTAQIANESPKNILKIEDFLPDKKNWSFSSGINIINSNGTGDYPVVYITQVAPGQYVVDQTTKSYDKENNGLSGFLSGMYGITNRVSLAISLNGQWLNTQYQSSDNVYSKKDEFRFNGAGFGLSYQSYILSDFTIFYGGVNINKGEVKSYVLGSSFNWIYDPLVLNISLGSLDGISKEKFSNDYVAYITTGRVIFAVNPEVNLSWGVSKDFINSYGQYGNQKQWRSTSSLLAGTTINLLEDLTGSVNVKGGVGGNKNSVISLGINYKM